MTKKSFYWTIVLVFLFVIACKKEQKTVHAKKETQANLPLANIVAIANKKFKKYLPTIEKTNNGYLESNEVHTGDFTGDGLEDVAIFFSIAPNEGGNTIVAEGLSLYKNTGRNAKVIAGYEPGCYFSVDTIVNGKIKITKIEYGPDDGHCCPSIRTPHTLTISKGVAY